MLRRAVGGDRADRAHVGFHCDAAHGGACLGHFLHHDDGVQIAQALTTGALGNGHAHEAGLAELGDVVPGIFFGQIGLRRRGLEDILRQLARSCLQVELFFGEFVHGVSRNREAVEK